VKPAEEVKPKEEVKPAEEVKPKEEEKPKEEVKPQEVVPAKKLVAEEGEEVVVSETVILKGVEDIGKDESQEEAASIKQDDGKKKKKKKKSAKREKVKKKKKKEEKPKDEVKPAEEVKPEEEEKPKEEVKPQEEEEVKPSDEVKPKEEEKPKEEVMPQEKIKPEKAIMEEAVTEEVVELDETITTVKRFVEEEEEVAVSETVALKGIEDIRPETIITQHPETQIVTTEKQETTFTCKFSRPAQSVRWFRNERELWTQATKVEIVTDEYESKLILHATDHRDIGEYYVLVDDVEKSHSAELIYKISPKLTYEGPTDAIAAGKHFDFTVKFTGYPTPHFNMTLNGKDLKLQASVETYDDFMSFRVKNVKESGTIIIVAQNEHGEDSLEIPMQVIDVPSAPLDLQASDVGSTKATLTWKAPVFSNGSDIIEYCVERKSVEYSRWRTVGRVPADTLSITVNDLFPNDMYAFRVSAVNDIGQGVPSKVAEVETTEQTEGIHILFHTWLQYFIAFPI
ncbi:fibronectin type III domain protein, partial [Ancylostoma ceylanicum]